MSTDKPGVIAIGQGGPRATWMCPAASEHDPTSPWSGYVHVYADARVHAVQVDELSLTPVEARDLARALRDAADHAEQHTDAPAVTHDRP